MKVLITGGAGFIGCHVAKRLIARGDDVVLYDNFDDFVYGADLKQLRLEQMFTDDDRPRLISGDILDDELLDTVFAEEGVDKVLHLAALANPGKSLEAPDAYTMVNVMGTLRVLEMVKKYDIVHMVVAGSSSVYNDEQTPFVETSYPLRPRSPYGASKAALETYCAMWHELYEIPITVLRFFSVYGPWGRPDMAPMIFARQVVNDEKLSVTRDRKRDFTYIDDIVDGVCAALDTRLDFDVINLGRGEPHGLEEFIRALETAAGTTANIEHRDAPPGEMRVTYANVDKARSLLRYEPKVSIEEGAQKLIDWMREQK